MGCATSKLDDLPAVALCRDRCNFLEEALRQSYALADAHVAYMQSLRTVGPTLHHFFTQIPGHCSDHHHRTDGDPAIPKPDPSKPTPQDHILSPSSSSSKNSVNSHIHFHSDSEPEDTDKDFGYFNQIHHNYLTLAPSPPPPTNSAWDFLNFFEPYERYEPLYNAKEEIHELKQQEPVKKIEVEQKLSTAAKSDAVEHKADVAVDKNVGSEKEPDETPGVSELMNGIQVQFDKASESGNDVLKFFEVGKFRFHQKNNVNQVSCKVLHAISPTLSQPFTMESSPFVKNISSDYQGLDKDTGLSSGNLSSTLQKLSTWEKKLYDEVKAEEKLRTIHERKCRLLKRLDVRGGDAHKVESTQSLIRSLSTKMKIAIHVVDKISITIDKLRNEELWPQINKVIPDLVGMWKAMLECHRSQCQAVAEGKSLDAIAFNGKLSYAHLEAAIQLKFELQNWNLSFFNWINTQKALVKSLNAWLLRCVLHEPEETTDGLVPFSPGRFGAPPVFVICNQWSQAMDRLSEKEVIEAIQGLFMSINQLLEPHIVYLRQRSVADKDIEKKVKILEGEEQKIQKLVQAYEKKMVIVAGKHNGVLLPGGAVHHSKIPNTSSLQSGLKQIFTAMERFTSDSAQAYEELCLRIEEDRHV